MSRSRDCTKDDQDDQDHDEGEKDGCGYTEAAHKPGTESAALFWLRLIVHASEASRLGQELEAGDDGLGRAPACGCSWSFWESWAPSARSLPRSLVPAE